MSIVKTLVISSAAIVGGVMVLGVIGAVAAGSSATKSIEGKSESAISDTKDKAPKTTTPKRTEAQQIMDCMDRAEVKQLDYNANSIMSSADVYTSLTGDMFSTASQGKGRLIVAAFTRCAPSTDSGGGLVTVYSASGDLLANGNF